MISLSEYFCNNYFGIVTGIDTFDCVHPSRLGRHGGALVLASHWNEIPMELDR